MFVAVLVVLLQRPHKTLPQRLVTGFSLAGQIEDSGIIRPIAVKTVETGEAQSEELFDDTPPSSSRRNKPANPLLWEVIMKEGSQQDRQFMKPMCVCLRSHHLGHRNPGAATSTSRGGSRVVFRLRCSRGHTASCNRQQNTWNFASPPSGTLTVEMSSTRS